MLSRRGVAARWRYIRAQLHRRLLKPLLAADRAPEYGARGVFFGLIAALLPALGVQMLLVIGWWWVVRRYLPRWDFHLIVALAWTWTTNVVTFPLLVYLYVSTGRLMLGRWERVSDFETFSDRLGPTLESESNFLARLGEWIAQISDRFGAPMLLGMIPWIVVLSWIGYRVTLGWLVARRERKARLRARRKLTDRTP